MPLIKHLRKQTRQVILQVNNQKLMHSLSNVAAVLAEYANGSNWAYKEETKTHYWIGDGNPEELAILALKRTFGPDAMSQIAKKVVGNG